MLSDRYLYSVIYFVLHFDITVVDAGSRSDGAFSPPDLLIVG